MDFLAFKDGSFNFFPKKQWVILNTEIPSSCQKK